MAKNHLSSEMVEESDLESASSDDEIVQEEYEPPRSYDQVDGLSLVKELTHDYLKDHPKLQLWLIKYPDELDVSQIKQLPINSIGDSESFDVDKKSFDIAEDLTAIDDTNNSKDQKYSLLLPEKSSTYTAEKPKKITRFFNISEKIEIPAIDWDTVIAQKPKVKPIANLRMRHFPTGYYIKDYKEAKEPVIPSPRKRKASNVQDTKNPSLNSTKALEGETPRKKHHHHHHHHHKQKHQQH